MVRSIFPYPGGKYYLADWIISYIPEHSCYVEPFGGSGTVLANKRHSRVEVFNDIDGDILHFFRILRDRSQDLAQWLNRTPYSRELHDQWSESFYNGERSDDPVERAGRFFYLRHTQVVGKYSGTSGFSTGNYKNNAVRLNNSAKKLEGFATRLNNVILENKDYSEVLSLYDDSDTFFYFDPPYIEEGKKLYPQGDLDHDEFSGIVDDLEADWIISFTDIPESLNDHYIVEGEESQFMNSYHEGSGSKRTERLVMNFDPVETQKYRMEEDALAW